MDLLNTQLHVASLYLGILGLLYFALSGIVIKNRWKHKVPIGAGEQMQMQQAIRVHGNFAEYVPLCSILLVVLELNKASVNLLHFFWISLICGRLLHAWGLSKYHGISKGRFIGTNLTFLALVGSSVSLVLQFFM
ncbi:MAG: MAPEG family protein [Pseudobdellovibrionaceae bacterium]